MSFSGEIAVATDWYLVQDGQKYGPYSATDLQRMVDDGRVRGNDLVWHEGMGDWQPARAVLDPPRSRVSLSEPSPMRPQVGEGDPLVEARISRPTSQFPGRLLTPSFFFLALLLFLL